MKKIKTAAAIILLFAVAFSLSSCVSIGGALGFLDDAYNSIGTVQPSGTGGYQEGNNYEITINSSGEANLTAARHALLSAVSVHAIYDGSSSSGAGVIFKLDKEKGDAYIVTNYHVVYNASQTTNGGISKDISVFLYGMEYTDYAINATYVGGALSYDVAVLKVEGSSILRGSEAIAASFANSDEISVLDTAIAIGNPKGLGISATVGHISVDSESTKLLLGQNKLVEMRVIRTDAPVNSGNSGGGLFNDKGELIGIVNSRHASTEVSDIGYAIPSNVVKNAAESILYYCDGKENTSMYRCLFGITVQTKSAYTEYDTETGKILKRESVEIIDINVGSLAQGKFKLADQLVSVKINGKEYEIVRVHSIVDAMLTARVGDTVETVVKRNGETVTVSIVITEAALTKVE